MSEITIPVGIEAEVEHYEEDGGPSLMVHVSITDPDGTSWSASGHVEPPITDEDLADLIVRTAQGAAAMYGSGVWMALQHRLQGGRHGS